MGSNWGRLEIPESLNGRVGYTLEILRSLSLVGESEAPRQEVINPKQAVLDLHNIVLTEPTRIGTVSLLCCKRHLHARFYVDINFQICWVMAGSMIAELYGKSVCNFVQKGQTVFQSGCTI